MGLPRTFIGFSSTDIRYYRLMQAWKKNENIDFNFTDCQLSNGRVRGRVRAGFGTSINK